MTPGPLVWELDPVPEPFEACRRIAHLPHVVFLDSSQPGAPLGRYSFLMADPVTVVRSRSALTEQRCTGAGARWVRVESDPVTHVRTLLEPFAAPPLPGLPPFQGGAAGYLGYDWGGTLERVPRPRYDDLAVPDVLLGVYDWAIAWDHEAERAWIVSTGMPETGPGQARRAAERLAAVRQWLANTATPVRRSARPPVRRSAAPTYAVPDMPGVRSTFTREGYLDAVSRVIEYIHAGDIFQANLSQRLEAPLVGSPLDLYGRLRARNPAPFSAFLSLDGVTLASASPERFLRVSGGGGGASHVEARPIKGTRPRGASVERDAALALALARSEKDKAENVMIVDLLRNDLSRVCRPGSVRAPELCAVEHYATVHHLVSTIVGELEAGNDVADLLFAAFPGGSITGAPKVRAMQVIAELEPTRRAVYCGAIGYWSVTGALDTSIVIRTFLALGDTVYFQAGGGIVADSDPEAEYAETLDKAGGLVAALAP